MKTKYMGKDSAIRVWGPNPDSDVWQQVTDGATHPRVELPIALMPDYHLGYGVPIGCVLPVTEAVIPQAVGVDIGCGMAAIQTNLDWDTFTTEGLKMICDGIRLVVPTGYNHHKVDQAWFGAVWPKWLGIDDRIHAIRSMGTLGGGNHFIELQRGDDDKLWIMVHTGSRGFGKKIADHHIAMAKEYCEKWGIECPGGLDYLLTNSIEGRAYLDDMHVAMAYAKANRGAIITKVIGVLEEVLMDEIIISISDMITIHHNFAERERYNGKTVYIHRKGATSAHFGEFGIIPGSQGSASYITRGLGNTDSYCSSSHGAGRALGRMEATRKLTEKDCLESMNGIVHDGFGRVTRGKLKGMPDLGEAPAAYKDIDQVMEDQKDLVEIVTKLTPLAVIKG